MSGPTTSPATSAPPAPTVPPVLEVCGLTVSHGGVLALDGVELEVAEGQVAGLIGPNGAGKTTFIDTVTGFTPSRRGVVRFSGREVTHDPPHERARLGLVRTFQSLELFDDLTVRENLVVASGTPSWRSTLTDVLRPKASRDDSSDELLATLELLPHADRLPTELSNGMRHRVALARALAPRPHLVLLDEPAAGLGPAETEELGEVLRRLPGLGTSVLLVDHDMDLVLGVSDRLHVLDFGRVIASGPPAEVRADEAVIAAYLGRRS